MIYAIKDKNNVMKIKQELNVSGFFSSVFITFLQIFILNLLILIMFAGLAGSCKGSHFRMAR